MAGKLTVATGGASIGGQTTTSSLSANGSPLGYGVYPSQGGVYSDNVITDCGWISVGASPGFTITYTSAFGYFTVTRTGVGTYNILVTAHVGMVTNPKAFHVTASDPLIATVSSLSTGNPTTITVKFRDVTNSGNTADPTRFDSPSEDRGKNNSFARKLNVRESCNSSPDPCGR